MVSKRISGNSEVGGGYYHHSLRHLLSPTFPPLMVPSISPFPPSTFLPFFLPLPPLPSLSCHSFLPSLPSPPSPPPFLPFLFSFLPSLSSFPPGLLPPSLPSPGLPVSLYHFFLQAIQRYDSGFETVSSHICINSYRLDNRSHYFRLQHPSSVLSIIEELHHISLSSYSLYPLDLCTTCSFLARYVIDKPQ